MDVLVPIDGSDCSERALEFAVTFAGRYDATLHVVHFSDKETDATDTVLSNARDAVSEVDADVELELTDSIELRPGAQVGREIVRLTDEGEYDHVVMGHHGSAGAVGKAILGSAAEAVVHRLTVPTTLVP